MKVSVAFGRVLKEERKRAGLTQAKLAEYSGLEPDTIGMYERGLREPLAGTVLRIADALNVEAGHIMTRLKQVLDEEQ